MSLFYKIAGKIEDLSKKYPAIDVREVAGNDPSNTKKYLSWMVKQIDKGSSKEDLYPTINLFHNLSQRNQLQNLPKSIDEYASLKDLEDKLKYISEESNRETRKKLKEQMKSVSGLPHIIFENDIFAVTRIDSRAESLVIGEGTSWCITMSNANYFDFYKANNVEFYFAILKKDVANKSYSKLAFDFQRDFDKNIIKETIWLASDTPFKNVISEMIEYYGEDLPKAFERCKNDAISRPNGILFKIINDPNATVKEYLEYKKNSEAATNPNMGDIDNEKIFFKIKRETKSQELIEYFKYWREASISNLDDFNFIRSNSDHIDWIYISWKQQLSEHFIREFADKVNWRKISRYQKLSEDFIREFADKVDWIHILENRQKPSKEIMREFSNRFNWFYISEYKSLSEEFIREFSDRLVKIKLLYNNNLDNDLKEKIKLHFDNWAAEAKSKNKVAKLQYFCNTFYKKALIKFYQYNH